MLTNLTKKIKSMFQETSINKVEEKKSIVRTEIENALQNSSRRPMVYLGDFNALTENIFGHTIILDTRDISLTPHLLSKGFWEIWITQVFLETIEDNMNVLEIGANVGYYTLLAASKVGSDNQIFAFEADSATYELLSKNIEINGFKNKVTLINKAVFSESKRVKFSSFKKHHGSNSLIQFSESSIEGFREEVKISEIDSISLDDYFEMNVPKIGLIKIDAEGSEPHIFRGMIKLLHENSHVKIICEFAQILISELGEDPEKFLDDLVKQGFCLSIIDPVMGIVEVTKQKLLEIEHCELFLYKKSNAL